MEFDAAAVEAEVRAAFDGYEAALGANDVGGADRRISGRARGPCG